MKKLVLSLILTLSGIVSVQAQRNTLLVYGNVGFDSQKEGNTSVNTYDFSPGVGYQWNNNWTAGINLGLGDSRATISNANVKVSTLSVGPFIRYAQPLGGIFAIYGQLNADYLSVKVGNYTNSGFAAEIFPAIGVNLKNSFALNFKFGSLSFTSQKDKGVPDATNTFHVGFGSGAGFGISKNFGLTK